MSGVQVPSPPPHPAATSAVVVATLRSFLLKLSAAPSEPLIVAFSGGPDSTALLAGLVAAAPSLSPPPRIFAAHLDHALDPESPLRAEAARAMAERLAVEFRTDRRNIATERRRGESLEQAARRVRYEFLEEVRIREGARWIVTAHHRDDQAETVLLRWVSGSGLSGLAAMSAVRGSIVRPLLELSRRDLLDYLSEIELSFSHDPANRDPNLLRSRLRHHTLPRLALQDPEFASKLARLADRARAAVHRIRTRLDAGLAPISQGERGPRLAVESLTSLPWELWPFALAELHDSAGRPFPPSSAACRELSRQLARPRKVEVACGEGWRWTERAGWIELQPPSLPTPPGEPFTYTFRLPGTVEVPELGIAFDVRRGPTQSWMFEGKAEDWADRVGLVLAESVDHATIRSRRAGDRLRPFGSAGSRKLKDLLIDRRVPREQRDLLPLFCVEDRIAWIPGVTLDARFRLQGEREAWIVTLIRR